MEPINEEPLDFLFKRAWGPDSIWDELKQKRATGTGQTTPESPDQPIQTNPTQTTPEAAQEMTPKTSYSMESIKPEEKAPFYGIKLMVAKFQIWYNRNMGGSLAVDGIWGKNTQAAWDNWVTKTYPEKKQEETLPSIDEEKTKHHTKTMNEEMFKTMVKEIIKERMDKNNQNTKNTGVMKVKLNEETLNAYIQEAIRQELNEAGVVKKILNRVLKKGKKAGEGAVEKGKKGIKKYFQNLTGNKKGIKTASDELTGVEQGLASKNKELGSVETQLNTTPKTQTSSNILDKNGNPASYDNPKAAELTRQQQEINVELQRLAARKAELEKTIKQFEKASHATQGATIGAAAGTTVGAMVGNEYGENH